MMDEQELQDQFFHLCGGRRRADRIDYLYHNSYPHGFNSLDPNYESKEDAFRRVAKYEGFSKSQIEMYLKL